MYTIINHAILADKLTRLRDESTRRKEVEELVKEISLLEAYEATRNLPLENVVVKTPLTVTAGHRLKDGLAIVPIIRAGLLMREAISNLIPSAKTGHLGMYRSPEDAHPVDYFCKQPDDCTERIALVVDPMLATGGSAINAINQVKAAGYQKVIFICIFAAPEGLEALEAAHPDVNIYIGSLDERLDENNFIVPGMGDAGDRIYGTK